MSLVNAENLSKVYSLGEIKVEALKSLSFKIEPASFVSFIGPSGSGKTTLLNLIGCLDKPTRMSGQAHFRKVGSVRGEYFRTFT